MSTKKMLMVIAAVALGIAGAVSSAQAGGKDDDGANVGGIKVGPTRAMVWWAAGRICCSSGFWVCSSEHQACSRQEGAARLALLSATWRYK